MVDKRVPVYLKKKLFAYLWKSGESVHGETRLKIGEVVKKSDFSLLNALISTELHFSSKPRYFATHIF